VNEERTGPLDGYQRGVPGTHRVSNDDQLATEAFERPHCRLDASFESGLRIAVGHVWRDRLVAASA
jgi:hypothetical protein